jgi:hypothetical protein
VKQRDAIDPHQSSHLRSIFAPTLLRRRSALATRITDAPERYGPLIFWSFHLLPLQPVNSKSPRCLSFGQVGKMLLVDLGVGLRKSFGSSRGPNHLSARARQRVGSKLDGDLITRISS